MTCIKATNNIYHYTILITRDKSVYDPQDFGFQEACLLLVVEDGNAGGQLRGREELSNSGNQTHKVK